MLMHGLFLWTWSLQLDAFPQNLEGSRSNFPPHPSWRYNSNRPNSLLVSWGRVVAWTKTWWMCLFPVVTVKSVWVPCLAFVSFRTCLVGDEIYNQSSCLWRPHGLVTSNAVLVVLFTPCPVRHVTIRNYLVCGDEANTFQPNSTYY